VFIFIRLYHHPINKPSSMPVVRRGKGKKQLLHYNIDCKIPSDDGIFEPDKFVTFLLSTIKVNGKKGNLGENVKVSREKSTIQVVAQAPFAKRYLKYLTKKYLKRNQLRDWLRVVSANKNSYSLKYFNIHDAEESEDEESQE